ncbi:MAG: ATP-dependent 6-phosphofructokinase [Eubacteriales bacterium]|nr:ATP-dependent 6-phosphofructokinase [Eubacteriales bacterium]
MKRIGILTSGGDSPGMNAAVWAAVRVGRGADMQILGVVDGFKGLIEEQVIELDSAQVEDVLDRGGTFLGTARCAEMMTEEGRAKAVATVRKLRLDGLIVVGGDGSYQGARVLSDRGVPTVGLPGTIDNDLAYTDYTIGFDTALNTVCDSVLKIRDTMRSHDRVGIIEVMGRHCGDIALNAAVACGADYVLVPELNYEEEFDLSNVARRIEDIYATQRTYATIILAEGVCYDMEHRAYEFCKRLAEKTGKSVRETVLGYTQRGGSPSIYDRRLAINMADRAVRLLNQGIGNRVIGRRNGEIFDMDITAALNLPRVFNRPLYDLANRLAGSAEELKAERTTF